MTKIQFALLPDVSVMFFLCVIAWGRPVVGQNLNNEIKGSWDSSEQIPFGLQFYWLFSRKTSNDRSSQIVRQRQCLMQNRKTYHQICPTGMINIRQLYPCADPSLWSIQHLFKNIFKNMLQIKSNLSYHPAGVSKISDFDSNRLSVARV